MLPNKLAPKVPNKIPRNLSFCYFVSFLIVLVTPFNKILEPSRAWAIFKMLFIPLFESIKIVVPEPCIFCWIPAAVIPNEVKTFFAKVTATFINVTANLLNNNPINSPGWII